MLLPPSEGRRALIARLLGSFLFILAFKAGPLAIAQTVIDDFQRNQAVLSLSAPGGVGSAVTGSLVGGERDLRLVLTTGNQLSTRVESGVFKFNQSAGVAGSVEVVWDGVDGHATNINHIGLGVSISRRAGRTRS